MFNVTKKKKYIYIYTIKHMLLNKYIKQISLSGYTPLEEGCVLLTDFECPLICVFGSCVSRALNCFWSTLLLDSD